MLPVFSFSFSFYLSSLVLIQSVKGILVGQKTPIFKKNKLPEYEHISFSLLYGEKTLGILPFHVLIFCISISIFIFSLFLTFFNSIP